MESNGELIVDDTSSNSLSRHGERWVPVLSVVRTSFSSIWKNIPIIGVSVKIHPRMRCRRWRMHTLKYFTFCVFNISHTFR